MKIGDIEFKNNLFLAPMAGVTDFAFRSIARENGADFSYSEMVSAKGLVYSGVNSEYKNMLHCEANENPRAVQLFGSEPEFMAKATALPEIQAFDVIDINMGCPAPKIVKNCDGSALLKDLDLATSVAKSVVDTCRLEAEKAGETPIPVTVKMRLGFSSGDNVSLELARRLQDVGVAAICLHGRTREQMYSGKANLDAIASLKSKIHIPVIGNGDVSDVKSYELMKSTGVDAIMIGRGALGRPYIFNNLKALPEPSSEQKKAMIKKHFELLLTRYPEKFVVAHMKKHLLWYVKGMPLATYLRLELAEIKSVNHALELIETIF